MFATERCCCDEAVFGRRRMRPAETKGPLCVEKATLSAHSTLPVTERL